MAFLNALLEYLNSLAFFAYQGLNLSLHNTVLYNYCIIIVDVYSTLSTIIYKKENI